MNSASQLYNYHWPFTKALAKSERIWFYDSFYKTNIISHKYMPILTYIHMKKKKGKGEMQVINGLKTTATEFCADLATCTDLVTFLYYSISI